MKITHILITILISISFLACERDRFFKQDELIKSDFISVKLDSNQYPDTEIEAVIIPYRVKMDSLMNEVVAYSVDEISKDKPNGALNNLITDILLEEIKKTAEVEIDFCMLNYGGLRRPLPAGNIIKTDVFQLMPFENEAVLVKLKAEAMHDLFSYLYESNGQPISNLEVHFTDSLLTQAIVNNVPWDSTRAYWVLTSDYTANGGDKMYFFGQRDSLILTGVLIRDVIFTYLDSLQNNGIQLNADTNARIFLQDLK